MPAARAPPAPADNGVELRIATKRSPPATPSGPMADVTNAKARVGGFRAASTAEGETPQLSTRRRLTHCTVRRWVSRAYGRNGSFPDVPQASVESTPWTPFAALFDGCFHYRCE